MRPTGRRGLLAVTAAVIATLACAVPAEAKIVLDKSIEGVRPGMSAAEVRQRLGKPVEVNRNRGTVPNDVWTYGRGARNFGRVYILFMRHGKKLAPAEFVGTISASERTASGIRVGLSLARLRARLPGLVCKYGICLSHDPNTYAGIATRFGFMGARGHTVVSKIELVQLEPPAKPKAPAGPQPPRPAAEGGSNVPSDFTAGCPCFPGAAISFDVVPPAHVDESYALVQSYTWDFGDGTKTSGWYESAAAHSYDKPGTYTVTLTMVDEGGGRWFITKPVEVKAPRPAAESPNPLMFRDFDVACADGSCTPGSNIFFNVVYAPEDGVNPYPTVVRWDFGDGTSAEGADQAYHAYSQPGRYGVTVTMADGDDEWYVTKQVDITG